MLSGQSIDRILQFNVIHRKRGQLAPDCFKGVLLRFVAMFTGQRVHDCHADMLWQPTTACGSKRVSS